MSLHKHFISCDWGTSNFRLAVVDLKSLEEVFSYSTDSGIKNLYSEFQKQSKYTQKEFFSHYFLDQLQVIPRQYNHCPIVISGMASANIGLVEMEYAIMPISGDGSNLQHQKIDLSVEKQAVLISGARSDDGVMRGEEVQAVGIVDLLKPYGNGILILPGTHSKHLIYKNGRFDELKTFMTGELFALLSKESILSSSVQVTKWDLAYKKDFEEGAEIGLKGNLAEKLFSIRVNGLLDRKTPAANYFLLSGMIIADEVRNLKKTEGTVFLAASSPLIDMYSIAIRHGLKKDKLVVFGSEVTRKATLRGQLKVLSDYEKFEN